VRRTPALATAVAAALLLAASCTSFPAGWVYVTRVTTTEATLVWTGRGEEMVDCHGPDAPTLGPTIEHRPRGLRFARVQGLAPDTGYVCRIGRGRAQLRVRFRTAPARGEPFIFAAVGDSGDGSVVAARLAQRILAGRPAFLVHLGDMAYPRSSPPHLQQEFFTPYARLLSRVPLFPTPGNHDIARHTVYRDVFAPFRDGEGAARSQYAFDWGDARFAAVSSGEFPKGGETAARWLAGELTLAPPGAWRFVVLHEPLYTSGRKRVTRGLRASLEPVLEAAHVDLVLAGHEHLYERALPACEYVPDARVLEVISGGGGANLDHGRTLPNFARTISATHYLRVRVTRQWLDIRAVGVDGQTLDRVHLRRGEEEACRSSGWPVADPEGGAVSRPKRADHVRPTAPRPATSGPPPT